MSFFAICPFYKRGSKVPKNGMNCNQSINIRCGSDSSRFSGQLSKHNKGIAKKDISLFLTCFDSPERLMH
jgi:hypothetical protein